MTYLLTLLFLKLALINEVWTQIGSNDTGKSFNYSTSRYYDMLHAVKFAHNKVLSDCTDCQSCYLYGSVPRNDTNCVPEGSQVSLLYIVYNPRDPFTNLMVKWFRSSSDVTSAMEVSPSESDEYFFLRHNSSTSTRNSPCGPLYSDRFSLYISNFTTDKNGYYWCQILINGSFLQPSQHAWFYADDSNLCVRQFYFRTAEKAQCARVYQATNVYPLNPIMSTIIPSSSTVSTYSTSSVVILYTFPTTTRNITELLGYTNSAVYLYIIGTLIGLVLILGIIVIILLISYIYKCQRKKVGQFMHVIYKTQLLQ